MNLYIHHGYTKAASTSIQNSLFQSTEFLNQNSFYYLTSRVYANFNNAYDFYFAAYNEDYETLRSILDHAVNDAKKIGLDNVIISAETLIYLFEFEAVKYCKLMQFLNTYNFDSIYNLLIVRNPRALVKSNLLQNISNGISDVGIVEFSHFMRNIYFNFNKLAENRLILNLDETSNIVNDFYKKFLGVDGVFDKKIDNSSAGKYFSIEMLVGLHVKLFSECNEININSVEADLERASVYDRLHKFFPSNCAEFYEIEANLNCMIESLIPTSWD